jgi:hypothetical protein
MARFGLKKQGRLWGLFHGSELVRETASLVAGNECSLSESRAWSHNAESAEQQPTYDNDGEYRNVEIALAEAKQHPPLEDSQKQRQRERLQRQIEALATDFESKYQRGKAIVWDADAEEELHALLHSLMELLELVGLSLEHGWAYTGAG